MVETALDLPPREHRGYLDAACAGNRELRAEVETLLRAHADAGTCFDRPVFDLRRQDLEDCPETAELDESIGPYRLRRLIGRGGMGRVYHAERTGGDGRQVAVKLLRPGMGSREMVRRFCNERQILARLEHPYISRILDGGATADGRPYLVMELVDGLPIDRYCDQHGLGATDRLELMRKVCDAVHFAHRHFVVHRDLKPANILVTAAGDPKLLDFGIAKLLRPAASSETALTTIPGLVPMTPDYASPEQVRGEPVTPASDVYALGVLLYELLTGRSPYLLASRRPSEVARAVCEQEPARPSLAVGRTGPLGLRQHLRGDLDTIVLTALHKDPERRYVSVEELSEDLERHLTGRQVFARRDTLGDRTRDLLRRHRSTVSLVAAALAALAVPVALAGVGRSRRRRRIPAAATL